MRRVAHHSVYVAWGSEFAEELQAEKRTSSTQPACSPTAPLASQVATQRSTSSSTRTLCLPARGNLVLTLSTDLYSWTTDLASGNQLGVLMSKPGLFGTLAWEMAKWRYKVETVDRCYDRKEGIQCELQTKYWRKRAERVGSSVDTRTAMTTVLHSSRSTHLQSSRY